MNSLYQQFWEWFVEHKYLFETKEIELDAIKKIDRKIKQLGSFAWEIGVGLKKTFSLTISPGGNSELLSKTKEIVSFAPELESWEFFYALPIKQWDNYFDVYVKDDLIRVDISSWRYIFYRTGGGKFDIVLRTDHLPTILKREREEVLLGLSEMVIVSIIGEEKRLERIDEIEIVKKFEDENENGTSIMHLRDHFEMLR